MRLSSIFSFLFLFSTVALAKMEVEVYPLDLADFEAAEKTAAQIVSPEGKLVPDKSGNRLIIYDTPENHLILAKALKKVRAPAANVRIRVSFVGESSQNLEHLGVDGKVGSDPTKASARVQLENMSSSLASLVQQELLVISGGKAHLRVGTDVPYADWFWNYGIQCKLWSGPTRWKEVGAQLVVEPYVIGSKVRVRLTPEFSYVLDQETLSTSIEKLTTEVFVENGQEIELGGLTASNRDFYSRFLVGYTHSGEKRNLRIVLKPTIELVTAQ
jgi:type II secretory pathway component GspD/PulD (secretin)